MTTQPATPLSELNPTGSLYPFALVFEVIPSKVADAAKDIWNIPKGTIITMVLAKIKTACAGSAANLIIGDDDDDNGYILAGAFCGQAADVIYGDAVAERGAYLTHLGGAIESHAGKWKVYTAAGKELKLEQSGTLTTAGVIEVFVFGYRFEESA